MKNNIRIDFNSRAFIVVSYSALICLGVISVGFYARYLYSGIKDSTINIENVLNIKDRVTIEIIDMNKLAELKSQLEKRSTVDLNQKFSNPFVEK